MNITLAQIYQCLGDETRRRMLCLLRQGPLCVCHFQSILGLPQVAVSKHLAYLRMKGLAVARRRGTWMIYSLPAKAPKELVLQLRCLEDCVRSNPVFQRDVKALKKVRRDCDWMDGALAGSECCGGRGAAK